MTPTVFQRANSLHHSPSIRRLAVASAVIFAAVLASTLGACQPDKVIESSPPAPPVPKFTGPAYLYGTVGSLTQVRGGDPLLVDGWGLVVGLHGTGSGDMPAPLRQQMLQIVRRHRLGEAFLASDQTAVVRVSGLIPPGAVSGTRFDLLVEAIEGSQTTSLEHGRLWSSDLAVDGANSRMLFSAPLAEGRGPIYFDPFDSGDSGDSDNSTNNDQPISLKTRAVVVAGGIATQRRRVSLVLNEPSWAISAAIGDRINQRFAKGPADRWDTAIAKDDRLIELNIPRRFATDPDQLVSLIDHLYLQQTGNFAQDQAQRLLDVLKDDPQQAERVSLAWQALGKQVWQSLRPLYDDNDRTIRLTALEAGSKLGDMRVVTHLIDLASSPDASLRQGAARLLADLPATPEADRALHRLLDDSDRSVRIAAYEALAANSALILDRTVFREDNGDVRFVLDLVPARKPMIYITQASIPRIAIFQPRMRFAQSLLAKAWDGRIRLRQTGADDTMAVYYKPFAAETAKTFDAHAFVPNFIFLMAHRPTNEQPMEGFDFSFGQVASVLHELQQSGAIEADLEVQPNRLAQAIENARDAPDPEAPRPEADPESGPGPAYRRSAEDDESVVLPPPPTSATSPTGARPE